MKIRILFTSIILSLLFINAKAAENSILDVKDNDFYIGEENAPITIIEYASMSCSHCADFHNDTLAELKEEFIDTGKVKFCLLYTSPSPRDQRGSRMPSSA